MAAGKNEFNNEEMRTLCASPLFVGFRPLDIAGILTVTEVWRKTCRGGAVVVDESTAPTCLGVVLSGYLHVYDSAFKGERHLVRIVRPGQVVGATLAATRSASTPALVTAHGDCVLAAFPLAAVRRLLKSDARLFENLAEVVREELQASWRKIALLSCPNISRRVMLCLQELATVTGEKTFAVGSTEAEFADYLGVSRSALARMLRKLAKEGRFTYRRDVFTLPLGGCPVCASNRKCDRISADETDTRGHR